MMTAGDHVGSNAFGNPCRNDEVANFRFDAQQISSSNAQPCGMRRMDPQRIGVRDFVKPLCIGASSMDLNRKSEGGNKNGLILLEIVGMDVTLDVSWNSVFRPAPFPHCL